MSSFMENHMKKTSLHTFFGMRSIGYLLQQVIDKQLPRLTETLISLYFSFVNFVLTLNMTSNIYI
jgi:hypothetical protein